MFTSPFSLPDQVPTQNDDSTHFRMVPRFKLRNTGEPIRFNDQVGFQITRAGSLGLFLPCSFLPSANNTHLPLASISQVVVQSVSSSDSHIYLSAAESTSGAQILEITSKKTTGIRIKMFAPFDVSG